MTNTEQAAARAAYLADLGVTMTAAFVPQSASRNRDEKDKTLNWVCTIARTDKGAPYRVDFQQGIAHIPGYVHRYGHETTHEHEQRMQWEKANETGKYPRSKGAFATMAPLPGPSIDDVLSCLISDADAGEHSFEDFCSESGYDEDSRKAEATWRACSEVTRKLSRLFTSTELAKLRELYSDY